MKFSKELMTDEKIQFKKIGNFVKRSIRNKWAEEQEELLRSLCPFPITYDVHTFSPNLVDLNFKEYEYTELLAGLWVSPQCLEISCRILQDCSDDSYPPLTIDQINSVLGDKYELDSNTEKWHRAKRIIFMPGHNLLGLTNHEEISRLMINNEDIFIKPHPITFDRIIEHFGREFGFDRIIDKKMSGYKLLNQCEEVYITSASEMAIIGVLLDKNVFNISNFFNEGYGAYYAIHRIIFSSKNNYEAKEKISNIIQSPYSGIILPFHNNVQERFKLFFDSSLKYRNKYKPLSPPWHPKVQIKDESFPEVKKPTNFS